MPITGCFKPSGGLAGYISIFFFLNIFCVAVVNADAYEDEQKQEQEQEQSTKTEEKQPEDKKNKDTPDSDNKLTEQKQEQDDKEDKEDFCTIKTTDQSISDSFIFTSQPLETK